MVELIQGPLELVIDMEYQAVALGSTEYLEHIIEVKGSFEDFKEGNLLMCSQIAGSIKKCYDIFKTECPNFEGLYMHIYLTLRDPSQEADAFLLSGKLNIDNDDNIFIDQCETTSAEKAANTVVDELNNYHGKSVLDDFIQYNTGDHGCVITPKAPDTSPTTQVYKTYESPILRMVHDLLTNMEIRSSRGSA